MASDDHVEVGPELLPSAEQVARDKQRLVLYRDGMPYVALVPLEDAQLLEELEDRELARLAEEVVAETPEADFIPWDETKAKLGL
jgi:hypothetical protein